MKIFRQGRGGRLWAATLLLAGASFALLCGGAAQAEDSEARHAESPYFAVKSSEPGVDRLPLKGTQVDVKILGPIADVTVTQTYRNEGQRPIEARYLFPGSTKAAVHAMTVRLGDRVLSARIKEKEAARIEYEEAKTAGKTTALLEQQRPNVFQMNVANILPGDDVRVELRYTELLVPRDGTYEFVFPTVVGPRYNSPQGEAAREKWVAAPYLAEGEASPASFDLRLTMATPLAVKDIASPSHAIDIARAEDKRIAVRLGKDARPGNGSGKSSDFILHYSLAGDAIESGLTLFRGTEENFFLAMVEPPKAVPAAAILPRDYIFVVDISGSMHGFPLDTAKVMLTHLLKTLRTSDSFNVMLFSGSSRMLANESVPATQANIDAAMAMLNQQMGGGGTEIVPALRRIAALPKRADISRNVVVITDGYVSVEREVFQLVRQQLGNSNVFAFGIGSSVNRALIEGIARAGQGEAFVITRVDQAAAQAERFRRMIEAPVLTQVKARFEGLQVYDVEPAQLPDVLGGRPVLVFGKWKGEPNGQATGKLIIEGRNANGLQRSELAVDGSVSPDAAALRHLWARERIAALADEEALVGGQAQKSAITTLGLRYGLLTNYTSFIAVDERARSTQTPEGVDQPLPLPEGVGKHAVGGATPVTAGVTVGAAVPSTPEPAVGAAVGLMLAMLLYTLRARRRSTVTALLSE